MMYLASFNYRPSKYRLVDLTDKSIQDVGYRVLKELVREHKVANLTLHGEVCGKNVSLASFPRIADRDVKIYIAKKLLIRGMIYKYVCIFGNGRVEECNSDTAFIYVNRLGCVNAYTKGEELVLKDGTYETVEVGRKEIKYCLEDYQELYKKYSNLGIGKGTIIHNHMRANIVFGKSIPEHKLESRFNSFISGHKFISIILSKCVVRQYGRVYSHYYLDKDMTTLRAKGLVGYLVTYYHPNIGTHDILISKHDKKLVSFIKKSTKVRDSLDTIKKLTEYSKEEKEDVKFETVAQIEDYTSVDECKLRVATDYELSNGVYKSEFGRLIIKDIVRVGNSQEKLFINKLDI